MEKDYSEFNKDKCKNDGYMNFCKDCRNLRHLVNKDKNNKRSKEYRNNNKEKCKIMYKNYIEKNKEKYKKIWKEKNEKHKEKYSKAKLLSDTNRRKIDPLFKLTGNIRSLIGKTIKNFGTIKKSKSIVILGCSFEEFKIFLENKFTEGMTWENYGKWHLDHIKPVSLAANEKEIYDLNHYSNFQPLWQFDNLSKGNNYVMGHEDAE
jgi:tRNA U34 5-carboxymethylaminomethyl modifying enzyme MnmG/GidA